MKFLHSTFVLSALGLSLSLTAVAGPFEDGVGAYNKKDYRMAATNWRSAARSGHAESQFNLGYMYQNGQGVEQSYLQAIYWYQQAADLDHADAKTALNRLNSSVAKEATKEKVLQEASIVNETSSTEMISREVSRNEFAKIVTPMPVPTEKIQVERIATPPKEMKTLPVPDPGFDDGSRLFEQGILAYQAGQYDSAFLLFNKAATKNHAKSQDYLGHLYFTGKGVVKSYSQALKWYLKAAEQGNIASQKQLAMIYSTGRYGGEQSTEQAAYWYERAAALGDVPAMYRTGIAYYEGKGVKQSQTLAIDWLKQAAAGGYEPAEIRLRFIALE